MFRMKRRRKATHAQFYHSRHLQATSESPNCQFNFQDMLDSMKLDCLLPGFFLGCWILCCLTQICSSELTHISHRLLGISTANGFLLHLPGNVSLGFRTLAPWRCPSFLEWPEARDWLRHRCKGPDNLTQFRTARKSHSSFINLQRMVDTLIRITFTLWIKFILCSN